LTELPPKLANCIETNRISQKLEHRNAIQEPNFGQMGRLQICAHPNVAKQNF
jgi:hypothetical protein